MIKNLKVKNLRIWETSRGWLGYEAKTCLLYTSPSPRDT